MLLPEMDLHHLLGRKWFFANRASIRLATLMFHAFVPVEFKFCTEFFVAVRTFILGVVGFFVAILFMVVELCQRCEGTWAFGALIVVGGCLMPGELPGRMFVSPTKTAEVPRVTAGMLAIESAIRRAERTTLETRITFVRVCVFAAHKVLAFGLWVVLQTILVPAADVGDGINFSLESLFAKRAGVGSLRLRVLLGVLLGVWPGSSVPEHKVLEGGLWVLGEDILMLA